MLPTQQLEQRRQRLARLQQERDSLLEEPTLTPSPSPSPPTTSSSTTTATTATTSTSTTPPAPLPPRRSVSTLPGEKTCWICYETSTESPSRPFIHACSCTLLCHSECLLEWISTRANSSSSSIPKCPVCATPILIKETSFEFLKFYRKLVKKLHKLSIVATVGGIAASGWLIASCYGVWVMKTFLGEKVSKALLEREFNKKLPLKLWLNLPLIPFALVLSRTPLIDSLLPFLPLTLALSTHSSHSSHSHHLPSFLSHSLIPNPDPYGLSDLSLQYPPSPTLTICLIPWLRILYFRTRNKVFRKVLGKEYYGKRNVFKGLAGMLEQAARDEQDSLEVLNNNTNTTQTRGEGGNGEDGEGGGTRRRGNGIELVAELEYEYVETSDREEEEEVEQDEEEHPLDGETTTTHNERRRTRTRRTTTEPQLERQREEEEVATRDPPSSLRIGIGRLTSLLIGALIYPALSSLVGSILFWIALRGGKNTKNLGIKSLRKLLGISTLIASSSSSSAGSYISGGGVKSPLSLVSGFLKFLNPFSFSSSSSSSLQPFSTPPLMTIVDPVWVRNTIGGGIVLLVRDTLELVVAVLEKKRKQSRTIVERPVGEGLSLQQE